MKLNKQFLACIAIAILLFYLCLSMFLTAPMEGLTTATQPLPSCAISGPWYTSNQIDYSQLDCIVHSILEPQIDDIMSRWPPSFEIGTVRTQNIAPSSNSQPIPKVTINGSMPSNITLNFAFPLPPQGLMGPKGDPGTKGEKGPQGPSGPSGRKGYWN